MDASHVQVPAECVGCVTAADVCLPEHGAYIVHVHPECPVHSEIVRLRERVAAFEALGRRLLAAHDPGYVELMQQDAGELRRLLGGPS